MSEKSADWKDRFRAWTVPFWKKWRSLIVAFCALLLLGLAYTLYWVPGTGFAGRYTPDGEWLPAKTLWDWMDLLLVPFILAAGAALFTWWTNKKQQEAEDRRARAERLAEEQHAEIEREIQGRRAETEWEIQRDRSHETTLQAYLDRMAELIRDHLAESNRGDPSRVIARARTLTVLSHLCGRRKGLVIRFLYEAGLIGGIHHMRGADAVVSLEGADLSGADLHRAVLWGAHLKQADLRRANLSHASLGLALFEAANLGGANLRHAILAIEDLSTSGAGVDGPNFSHANLAGADLTDVWLDASFECQLDLRELKFPGYSREENERLIRHGGNVHAKGADFSHANLAEACLVDAHLYGAQLNKATLTGANLSGANLEEACLTGADLTAAILDQAYLRYANLREALVAHEQLAQAKSLEGATLPDGTVCSSKVYTES